VPSTTLTPGVNFGPYQIVALLGVGGMGEVYRARDTRLKRDIAIKVLPEGFSQDPDRLARFQREAELLASLNHPHIAAIYGREQANGVQALVLELVEGPTLADRIARGPISLDEARPIARQIAEALEAAHEQGIVHRDLKPANIKLRKDGAVKILDFGLAKALPDQPTMVSDSATVMGGTLPGLILGTAPYMSPEQATGKEAGRATDIWAFGCVLYEMLTGRPAFEGQTVGDIIAGILRGQPDWNLLPADLPVNIRRLLRHCLEKDRRDRLKHIGDAGLEMRHVELPGERPSATAHRGMRKWSWALGIPLGALIAVPLMLAWRPARPASEMRLEIAAPPTPDPTSLAISPDGQMIVFLASGDGPPRLAVRSLDSVSIRPLAGTEGGFYPFWAADNRSVGFFAEGKLKRIDIASGLVRELANAPNPFGGAWGRDGTILFTPNATGSIFRIPATGGEPVAVTKIQPQQTSHGFPLILPDGRHFLYYVRGTVEARGVYAAQIDGTASRRVVESDSPAVLASSGRLLFTRQSIVFAQDFDSVRLTVSGTASPLGQQVAMNGDSDLAALSASLAGPIVYRAGSTGVRRQFVWFDRSGRELGAIGDADGAAPEAPTLSPDAKRVALYRTVNGNLDIWILDLGLGALNRFTSEGTAEAGPIWSADGSRIVFNSNRTGVFDLYEKPASGIGKEQLLLATAQNKQALDWSPDSRFILYRSPGEKTGFDLWALPLVGERKPFPVVQTVFEERDGQFSPDGKWVAYQSNESGRVEIYVRPFPDPGPSQQVSPNGGAQVRWARDGRELFYIGLDGRLMAVPVLMGSGKLETGTPAPLFATHVGGALQATIRQQYMVSPDGQRFLMNNVQETTLPITVIVNWTPKP